MHVPPTSIPFAIGIASYNEGQNILTLLERIEAEADCDLQKIVIVSDACRDDGETRIREFAAQSRVRVELITNLYRLGKPAAVNRIIRACRGIPVIALVSADVLPSVGVIRRLVREFTDPGTGVAGARIRTLGPAANLASAVSRLLYDLHHEIALRVPKSTEVTVFRNTEELIPENTTTDEAELEAMAKSRGLAIRYVPEAVVFNQSPTSLIDYFRQRVRVSRGHLALARRTGYRIGTLDLKLRLRVALRHITKRHRDLGLLAFAAGLEGVIFLYASAMFWAGEIPHSVWSRSESAKRVFGSEVSS